MRFLTSAFLFLVACGLIAYSYVGAYVKLVREMEQSETLDEASAPILQLFEYLAAGGAPQYTGFLYFGLLLFAIAVVNVIVRVRPGDDDSGDAR